MLDIRLNLPAVLLKRRNTMKTEIATAKITEPQIGYSCTACGAFIPREGPHPIFCKDCLEALRKIILEERKEEHHG